MGQVRFQLEISNFLEQVLSHYITITSDVIQELSFACKSVQYDRPQYKNVIYPK